MNKYLHSLPFIAVVLASVASACQVPVFRYALERWPADRYDIVVLHDGPLDAAQKQWVQQLGGSDHRSPLPANCKVDLVAADETKDPVLRSAWAEHGEAGRPVLVTLYPLSAQEVPDRLIEAGPLDAASVQHVVDSPLRQTIAKRLIGGESAVWVFVPCGDPKQDQLALETLHREVKKNEDGLELPEQEEIEEESELLDQVDIELRLDFSVVTLDRDDPKEQYLLKMLLASEPDLEQLNQPMAFPVLGRGRVLYALVGKGISGNTIGAASRFIIGPCSCQVKNQNPGFDLLMAQDWEGSIGKAKLSDPLPDASSEPVLLTIPPGRKSR
jgi:hypothetical protein